MEQSIIYALNHDTTPVVETIPAIVGHAEIRRAFFVSSWRIEEMAITEAEGRCADSFAKETADEELNATSVTTPLNLVLFWCNTADRDNSGRTPDGILRCGLFKREVMAGHCFILNVHCADSFADRVRIQPLMEVDR